MRFEHGAARGLGRMGREHELDPQAARPPPAASASSTPPRVELREGVGERLARNAPLGLVLAAPADPVVLLGDVDELEEERERSQHGGLALEAEPGDRVAERDARASRACIAGERANPLLVVEELLALLLDEHAPEQIAEQANVGAECGVGRHRSQTERYVDADSAVGASRRGP